MLRFFASLVALLALTGCVVMDETPAAESREILTMLPGRDALSLEGLSAIPGASVRYDDVARLVYRGDAPVTVAIRLDAGSAWRLVSPATLTMQPGESATIAVEVTLAEEATEPGPATLSADVMPHLDPAS